MSISTITLGNFKGIQDTTTIEIKPITVFYGPNSSGKSSCLHALASLSQTMKLSKQTPLILDDELADVHLGRYRDVAHSKSYADPIILGFTINDALIETVDIEKKTFHRQKGVISACYFFSCNRKTQQILMDKAQFSIGEMGFSAKRKSGTHTYEIFLNNDIIAVSRLGNAFLLSFDIMGYDWEKAFPLVFPLMSAQKTISKELLNIRYLGPFRQAPKRQYPTRGANPKEVGPMGENTVTLLANECLQRKKRPNIEKINDWLKAMSLANQVSVSRLGTSDMFSVSLSTSDSKSLSIADLGYGLSQILPVLTQCSFSQKGSTLLFEQPEIHLHPLAAKELAQVFISTHREKNINIVIETHSESLIYGLQQYMRGAPSSFCPDDIALYKVERMEGKSCFKKVDFDEYFDTDVDWRQGTML